MPRQRETRQQRYRRTQREEAQQRRQEEQARPSPPTRSRDSVWAREGLRNTWSMITTAGASSLDRVYLAGSGASEHYHTLIQPERLPEPTPEPPRRELPDWLTPELYDANRQRLRNFMGLRREVDMGVFPGSGRDSVEIGPRRHGRDPIDLGIIPAGESFDDGWNRIRQELFGDQGEEEDVPSGTVLRCAVCNEETVPRQRYNRAGLVLCRGCTPEVPQCRAMRGDGTPCVNRMLPGTEAVIAGERCCPACAVRGPVLACGSCATPVWRTVSRIDGVSYCGECNLGLPRCANCNRRFNRNNHRASWQVGRCSSCQPTRGNPIQSHRANVLDTLQPDKGSRLFGCELEVGADARRHNINALASDAWDQIAKDAIIKHDGSINIGNYAGFEIVTRPLIFENQVKFWTDYIAVRSKALRSHDIKTCGFHVHVTKKSMTQGVISKLVVFINDRQNEGLLTKVCRRYGAPGEARDYAEIKKKTYGDAKYQSDSRYEALNLLNADTVEFRIFRGSLNLTRILACLEFTKTLIEFCETCSHQVLNSDGYLEYMKAQPKLHSLKAVVFGTVPHEKSTVKVVVEKEGVSEEALPGEPEETPSPRRVPVYAVDPGTNPFRDERPGIRVWAREDDGPITRGMEGRYHATGTSWGTRATPRRAFVIWEQDLGDAATDAAWPEGVSCQIGAESHVWWYPEAQLSTSWVSPRFPSDFAATVTRTTHPASPPTSPARPVGVRVRALREINGRVPEGATGIQYLPTRPTGSEQCLVVWDEPLMEGASHTAGWDRAWGPYPHPTNRSWNVPASYIEVIPDPVGTRVRAIRSDAPYSSGVGGIRTGDTGTWYQSRERTPEISQFVIWDRVVHEGNEWPDDIPHHLGDPTYVWYTRSADMEEIVESEVVPFGSQVCRVRAIRNVTLMTRTLYGGDCGTYYPTPQHWSRGGRRAEASRFVIWDNYREGGFIWPDELPSTLGDERHVRWVTDDDIEVVPDEPVLTETQESILREIDAVLEAPVAPAGRPVVALHDIDQGASGDGHVPAGTLGTYYPTPIFNERYGIGSAPYFVVWDMETEAEQIWPGEVTNVPGDDTQVMWVNRGSIRFLDEPEEQEEIDQEDEVDDDEIEDDDRDGMTDAAEREVEF